MSPFIVCPASNLIYNDVGTLKDPKIPLKMLWFPLPQRSLTQRPIYFFCSPSFCTILPICSISARDALAESSGLK